MILVSGPRGSGRSTELLRLCEASTLSNPRVPSVIVSMNRDAAHHLHTLARDLRVNIRPPILFQDLVGGGRYGLPQETRLFLDDTDEILRRLFPYEIVAVSLEAPTFRRP